MHDRAKQRVTIGTFGIVGTAILVALTAVVPSAQAQTMIPSDPLDSCPVEKGRFATWFRTGTVSANGEVGPANSIKFPDQPNCSFYEWSEQMFLWLTSPAPDGGRVFNSPAFFDVSAPDAKGERRMIAHGQGFDRSFSVRAAQFGPHGLPVVLDDKGRLLEVVDGPNAPNGNSLVRDTTGAMAEVAKIQGAPGAKAALLDAAGKTVDIDRKVFLAEDSSAQDARDSRRMKHVRAITGEPDKGRLVRRLTVGDRSVFVDANGNTVEVQQGQAGGGGVLLAQNGSLVYYASMINDVFAYLRTGVVKNAFTPAPTKFPTTQAELDKVVAFAAANAHTFPDPQALAIEVKTAWIETTGLDTTKFITVKATVPSYDTTNAAKWVEIGKKDVILALVGMHVVGSTAGHPEMIWATFEHLDNTPNAAYSYTNAAGGTTDVPQNTAGKWLFAKSDAVAPFNAEDIHFKSPDIVAMPGKTVRPVDVIRWKAWGAASNAAPNPGVTTAGSNAEIISINNSVRGQLLAGDLRRNYFFAGATWTKNGEPPELLGDNQVGTSALANTTMETFQQGTSNQVGGSNCFSCHDTNEFAVSHFFFDLLPLF